MSLLTFAIGAPVHCADGEVGGKLTHVVANPDGYRVTDLILVRGLPLISSEARVVPIAAVDRTTEEAVWLSMPGDALAGCNAYEETFDAIEDPSAGTAPAFDETEGGYGTAPVSPAPTNRHLRRGQPGYQLVMGRETEVRTLHGLVGHVERLLVEGHSTQITQVVARKGLIRVDYLAIPAEMIAEMSDGEILLAASQQEVEELPRYPA